MRERCGNSTTRTGRRCLASVVEFSIGARRVEQTLDGLFTGHGEPPRRAALRELTELSEELGGGHG